MTEWQTVRLTESDWETKWLTALQPNYLTDSHMTSGEREWTSSAQNEQGTEVKWVCEWRKKHWCSVSSLQYITSLNPPFPWLLNLIRFSNLIYPLGRKALRVSHPTLISTLDFRTLIMIFILAKTNLNTPHNLTINSWIVKMKIHWPVLFWVSFSFISWF